MQICSPRLLALTLSMLLLVLPATSALGKDAKEKEKEKKKGPITNTDHGVHPRPYLFFELHGYFRFRSDLFYRLDLGVKDTARYVLPLSQNKVNNRGKGANTLASANIRLRLEPTLNIGESFKINAQLDVLDNLVLGSTPDFHKDSALTPLSFFTRSQAPPQDGSNGFIDSIRFKRVWAEWTLFNFLLAKVGRMPHHLGLGMLHNAGRHWDSDFGDSVDRLYFEVPVPNNKIPLRIGASWDYFSEGAISTLGSDYFGQGYDLDQLDDFHQWMVTIYSKPVSIAEKDRRKQQLASVGLKSVFIDWAVTNLFRVQPLATDRQDQRLPALCRSVPNSTSLGVLYDCYALSARDAFFWIPDVWFSLHFQPKLHHRFRIEAEFAYVFANIKTTQVLGGTNSRKELRQWGLVTQFEYRYKSRLRVGLEIGVASGDNAEFFGILDGQNLVAAKDSEFLSTPTVANNRRVLNFKFNRDYHVDLILFRELIGAVTNAIYIKPSVQYWFIDRDGYRLGGDLAILWARALEKDATPGNVVDLGVETDLRLYYHYKNIAIARIEYGMFFPSAAFRNLSLMLKPKFAATLQFQAVWRF